MEKESKIGNVTLNLSYYRGSDFYSDGEIESDLYKAVRDGNQKELLQSSTNYAVLYHLSDIRHSLLEWYPFTKEDSVLEIGSGCGGITGLLSEKCKRVTCIELSKKRSLINAYRNKEKNNIEMIVGNFMDIEANLGMFDVITLIGVWEYSQLYISDVEDPFFAMLSITKKHLAPGGHLLIAIENKMGLKYLNGAPEDHTNVQYSGVNDYISGEKVRTFSKPEMVQMLEMAGFTEYDFYYPLPDYKLPSVIYSDRYKPMPSDIRIFGKEYASTRLSNFNEAAVYDQICMDDKFPYFANSFLISVGERTPVVFASYQRERVEDKRIATVIYDQNGTFTVKKYGLTDDSSSHIADMEINRVAFSNSCLPIEVTEGNIRDNVYYEKYIEGDTVEEEFFAYRHDKDKFISRFNQLKNNYLTPSENDLVPFSMTEAFKNVFGEKAPKEALSMKVTNADLILSNLKRQGDSIVAFDLEWCFDFPIPYEYPIWRAAKVLYEKYNLYLNKKISKTDFLRAVGFDDEKVSIFENMEKCFSYYVTGQDRCEVYTDRYRKQIISPQYRIY